jgi:E3 ubiquitin-protein ligase HUWE1
VLDFFFIFLVDATRENRWLAALMAEFGNDSKDVLLDIGMIHREILWQVALIEDSKAVIKKDDGNITSSVTTDLDVHASEH